jgi:hypothetical protein
VICKENDKVANDDEKIMYENSSKRMMQAIKTLQKKEKETFWSEYVKDVKNACSRKKKEMKLKEIVENKN